MASERTFTKRVGKQTVTRTATTEVEAVQLQHYGYIEEKPTRAERSRPAPSEAGTPPEGDAEPPPTITPPTEAHFDY